MILEAKCFLFTFGLLPQLLFLFQPRFQFQVSHRNEAIPPLFLPQPSSSSHQE